MGSSRSSTFIFFFFFTSVFRINPSSSAQVCKPASCDGTEIGPQIRFPFRLIGKQDRRCGYPGFDLSCDRFGQTILTLPRAGNFIVNWIEYATQSIYISDPNGCLPSRIANFSVDGSAFRAPPGGRYNFFNCSLGWKEYSKTGAVPVPCSPYFPNPPTILVLPKGNSARLVPSSSCTLMPNLSIPLTLTFAEDWEGTMVEEDLALNWNEPDCRKCELMGLYCGFKSDSGLDIGCSKPRRTGLSRGAKYGIIVGVAVPGLVFLIGLLCLVSGKLTRRGRRSRGIDTEVPPSPSSSSTAVIHLTLPDRAALIAGLDATTIESYPKTVLGENFRLPEQGDGTCPICLSEYQPKETLRTIPECNHYFHALCVDEWLKLNRSCPLCRNSPEIKLVTPCTSMSSTFSTSSSSSA